MDSAGYLEKNQSPRKTTTKHQNINSRETHIFTFEPRDFWADPEVADVVHIYIIAKLLSVKYLSFKW